MGCHCLRLPDQGWPNIIIIASSLAATGDDLIVCQFGKLARRWLGCFRFRRCQGVASSLAWQAR